MRKGNDEPGVFGGFAMDGGAVATIVLVKGKAGSCRE
jgi:hypothetical protein